MQQYVSQSRI